jgi:hydrogenase maturation protease
LNRPDRRTLVLGLGNTILTDDAIGLLAVREAERQWAGAGGVEFCEASIAGFDLLELLAGFDTVIIVDAIKIGRGAPGTIYSLVPEDLPQSVRLQAIHEIDLATALALGAQLGAAMPDDVVILAVEVVDDLTLGEQPTPVVAAAIPSVAARILAELSHRGLGAPQ